MDLYGIQIVIVTILLVGTTTAQHDSVNNDDEIGSTTVKDTLLRMEKKMGAMEKRIDSVERELKEQKEVNVKLTLKVADLTHQMSVKKQNVTCRCMKKSPSPTKSAITYFSKLVKQPKQSILSKQPSKTQAGQYGMIRMLMQSWKKHEERITALEDAFLQTPSAGKVHDASPSLGNSTMAHGHQRRFKEGDTSRPGRALAAGIAFTAYLNHALTNIGKEHIIQMRGIVLNEGNGYNQHTGIFSAPQAGVYMFSYAVVDSHAHTLRVNLVVNGSIRVGAITYPRYSGYYQQGGNLAILRLTAGQSVWLTVAESGDNIYGSSTYRYSTFSGVFLYA